MSIVDFRQITVEQRLDLVDEIWESLDDRDVPLTDARRLELNRRIQDIDAGEETFQDAFASLEALRA